MKLKLYNYYKKTDLHYGKRSKTEDFARRNSAINFNGGKEFVLTNEFIEKQGGVSAIVNKINNAIGKTETGNEFFFDSLLRKSQTEGLNVKSYKIKEGLVETLNIFNHIKDIINSVSNKIAHRNIFETRALEKEKNHAFNLTREILEVYKQCSDTNQEFESKVALEIADLAKNYSTRDERTINRAVTATVSAIFSSNDFYNISMLQKDDKTEAKKAQKSRLKQEMTRMLLSAGLTFITLGALDKITRKSTFLNAGTIAISALMSEIISRLLNKVSLLPLTPKQAEKIAKKRKHETTNENETKTAPSQTNNASLFKPFATENKGAMDILYKNVASQKTPKHKHCNKIIKVFAELFVLCNLIYLLGQIKTGKSQKKIGQYAIDFIEKVTRRTDEIDLSILKADVNKLKQAENAGDIQTLLNQYVDFIDSYTTPKLACKKDVFLWTGLIEGIGKIPKTIYTPMTAPIKAIQSHIFKPANTNHGNNIDKLKKMALQTLHEIIEKNKTDGKITSHNASQIINEIKKNTRNIALAKQETGNLANLSRTLVTIISTYFFVNDYRNRVLIESEGKDIDGAQEEMNEKIGHKLANFIINGTLMNTFNSTFKHALNSSLLCATIIPTICETLNETLIRFTICQPVLRKNSREEIIDFEEKLNQRKGFLGWWTKKFKKLTGKKTLCEKIHVKAN